MSRAVVSITDISDQFPFKTSSVQLLAEKLLFSGPDYVTVQSFRPIAAASKNPQLLGQTEGRKEGRTDRQIHRIYCAAKIFSARKLRTVDRIVSSKTFWLSLLLKSFTLF